LLIEREAATATAAAAVGSAVKRESRAAVRSLPEQLPAPLRAAKAVTFRRHERDLEDGVAFTKLLERVTVKSCGACWVADGPGAELRPKVSPLHCLHLRARLLDCYMAGCEAKTNTDGRAGSGRKPCAEWMRLGSKRGRCVGLRTLQGWRRCGARRQQVWPQDRVSLACLPAGLPGDVGAGGRATRCGL
jgi:hypothetical protein